MSRASDKLRYEIMCGERILGPGANLCVMSGYRARLHGKSRRCCPYKKAQNPSAFAYWSLGWDNADNDKKATVSP